MPSVPRIGFWYHGRATLRGERPSPESKTPLLRTLPLPHLTLLYLSLRLPDTFKRTLQGALHYQCVANASSTSPSAPLPVQRSLADTHPTILTRRTLKGGDAGGDTAAITFCQSDPGKCALTGETCTYFADNPASVISDYDSVLDAILGIVQVRACLGAARALA